MRADRLISLLMLLQTHNRMTARELAEKLEVSERTILRDIDALSGSGVPVVADRGAEGGFSLSRGYRNSLAGLTDSELRAVFLLSIPSQMAELGLDKALTSALVKLAAEITMRRGPVARMRLRVYLDASVSRRNSNPPPQLSAVADAVQYDYRVRITYRLQSGPAVKQWVHAYGLVSSEGLWHLLYIPESRALAGPWELDEMQALPLSRIENVERTLETFIRRQDFDLPTAWDRCRSREAPPPYEFTVLVAPELAAQVAYLGLDVRPMPHIAPDDEGRVAMSGVCPSFEEARARVLALGRGVEVVQPEALRRSVADYAEQIVKRYAERPVLRPAVKPPPAPPPDPEPPGTLPQYPRRPVTPWRVT